MKRLRLLAATLTITAMAMLLLWDLSAKAQKPADKSAAPAADRGSESPKLDTVSSEINARLAADAAPERVVTAFLEAIRRGDKQAAASLLCTKARGNFQAAGIDIALPGSPQAKISVPRVDYATPNGDAANVLTQWHQADRHDRPQTHEVNWFLRKEPEGWRITSSAMSFPPGSEPLQAHYEAAPFDVHKTVANFLRVINGAAVQQVPPSTVAAGEPKSREGGVKRDDPPLTALKVLSIANSPAVDMANSLQQVFRFATIVPDPVSNSIVIRGPAKELDEIVALAAKLDEGAGGSRAVAATQLQVYPVAKEDAETFLKVLRIVHAGSANVRMEVNPRGQLIAHATASEHAKIRRTLEELQKTSRAQVAESRPGERDVFAQVDGIVTEVLVKTGDNVKAGQELVKLKNPELKMRLKNYAADIQAAGARWESLDKLHRAAQIGVDKVLEAKADLENLKRQYNLDELKLQLMTVKSPIDGKVVTPNLREKLIERPVSRGESLLAIAIPQPEPVSRTGQGEFGRGPQVQYVPTPTYTVDPATGQPKALHARPANTPYQKAEQKANKLAAEYHELSQPPTIKIVPQESKAPAVINLNEIRAKKQEELKAEIRCEVEIAFQARQQAQTAELEALRKKLNQIETSLKSRDANREAIINRRVEELINPDVKWDTGAPQTFYKQSNPSLPNTPTLQPRGQSPPRTGESGNVLRVPVTRTVNTPDGPRVVIEERTYELPTANSTSFAAATDDQALQGQWQILSAEEGGHANARNPFDSCEINGDKLTLRRKSGKNSEAFRFTLDPSHDPKHIDLTSEKSHKLPSKGIYRLNENTLTLCVTIRTSDSDNLERPTAFESKADTCELLVVCHLQNPAPASKSHTATIANTPPGIAVEQPRIVGQSIEGAWQVISSLDGGNPSNEKLTTCVITKDTLTFFKENDPKPEKFSYKIDPNLHPKEIDLWEGTRQSFKGIYESNGDELTICLSEASRKNNRPDAFESKPNSPNDILIIFKRANPR